jgi:hypothetical protein
MEKKNQAQQSTTKKEIRTDSQKKVTSTLKDNGKRSSGGAKSGTSSTGPRKR